jgi:SMC interacting uncharacterized protein involved in chromosome segregation
MTTESHPSLGEIKAQLGGLDRYLKSEFGNIKSQLDPLKDLPLKVERLSANHESLEKRVKELEDDKTNSGNKLIQWVSIITVVIIGLGSIIINLVQVTHG